MEPEKIIKAAVPTPTEKILANWGERVFLPLWSYPSPQHPEKRGKGTNETCDLLALVGDEVVVFSDKCPKPLELPRVIGSDGSMRAVPLNRWMKRAVFDSAKQLWGAEKQIRENPNRIFRNAAAKHPLRIPRDISSGKVHLVAIANGAQRAMAEFWGESKSPMLVLNSVFRGEKAHRISGRIFPVSARDSEHMLVDSRCCAFQAGDLDPQRPFVHIFDETGFHRVMGEMDTGPDLVKYLAKRESAFRSDKFSFLAADEEVMLFHYMAHIGPDGEHDFFFVQQAEREAKSREHCIVVDKAWHNEKVCAQYAAKKRADKVSYLWDGIISDLHRDNPNIDDPGNPASRALAIMAQESRFNRRMLCGHIVSKIKEGRPWLGREMSKVSPGCVYVFSAFPTNDAKVRILTKAACVLTLLDMKHRPEVRIAVGIHLGMENDLVSWSVMSVRRDELYPDDIRMAREIGEKCGLFKEIQYSIHRGKEFPDE